MSERKFVPRCPRCGHEWEWRGWDRGWECDACGLGKDQDDGEDEEEVDES